MDKNSKRSSKTSAVSDAPESQEDTDKKSEKRSVRKQILVSLAIIALLVAGTFAVVLYAKGYRLFINQGSPKVSKTGILNITSTPTGSQVYIDGHPTTATNNTINLNPGKYTIKVTRDGYNDWQKDVQIQTEVVTSVDALLFPKAPTLQSISTFGVDEMLLDPSGTKLAFKIASQSARKNGIYIFDMTARILPVLAGQSSSTQIVDDTTDSFSTAMLSFSPDGTQLLASVSASLDNTNPEASQSATYYLLNSNGFNSAPQDITATISDTLDLWKTQRTAKQTALLKSLKPKVAQFAEQNFRIIAWSPDDKKILYQASQSAQMPIFLTPRRIGNNLLYERRDLKKDAIYVYNPTEDVNTRIVDSITQQCTQDDPTCTTPFMWFPDSGHIIYVYNKKIQIVEDDGSNMTTVYAGPFIEHYVFPWPDGSKLVILTNLGNPSVSPTLYTIGLK